MSSMQLRKFLNILIERDTFDQVSFFRHMNMLTIDINNMIKTKKASWPLHSAIEELKDLVKQGKEQASRLPPLEKGIFLRHMGELVNAGSVANAVIKPPTTQPTVSDIPKDITSSDNLEPALEPTTDLKNNQKYHNDIHGFNRPLKGVADYEYIPGIKAFNWRNRS